MFDAERFAGHLARAVELFRDPGAKKAQKQEFRALVEMVKTAPVTVRLDHERLLVNGKPVATPTVGALVSRLDRHGVNEIALPQDTPVSHIFELLKAIAEEPARPDDLQARLRASGAYRLSVSLREPGQPQGDSLGTGGLLRGEPMAEYRSVPVAGAAQECRLGVPRSGPRTHHGQHGDAVLHVAHGQAGEDGADRRRLELKASDGPGLAQRAQRGGIRIRDGGGAARRHGFIPYVIEPSASALARWIASGERASTFTRRKRTTSSMHFTSSTVRVSFQPNAAGVNTNSNFGRVLGSLPARRASTADSNRNRELMSRQTCVALASWASRIISRSIIWS